MLGSLNDEVVADDKEDEEEEVLQVNESLVTAIDLGDDRSY